MNLEQQKTKARELFSEYSSEGYNGGESGLRCTECDCKYRGDAGIVQLCPMCQSEKLIEATHTAAIEEVVRIAEGMKKSTQIFDDFQVQIRRGYNQALTDLITAIKQDKQ